MNMRTLEMWKIYMENTGKKNITDYFIRGDVVNGSVLDYVRENMPLETDKPDYVQLDDVQGYHYDLARALKPVYPTFAECGGQWRYYGCCCKFETVNRL